MRNYYDLCMDVQKLGDELSLEVEVAPMKKYKYQYASLLKGDTRELRITFRKILLEKPFVYTYSISPELWERYKNYDEEYDKFIKTLIKRVKSNLIYI